MPSRRFFCVLCGTAITGDKSFFGSQFSCPNCNARISIPYPPSASLDPIHTAEQRPTPLAISEYRIAVFTPTLRAHLHLLALAVLLALLAVSLPFIVPTTSFLRWLVAAPFSLLALLVLTVALCKAKSRRYELTSQRLIITTGLLAKHFDELELYRVKDILVAQSLWQRLLNYGSITILSTDDSTPRLLIPHIINPLRAKELIRDACRAARTATGLRTTEFIQS